MALLLEVGKEQREIKTPTFKECQKIVGGLVELVRINDDEANGEQVVMLVNEEGLILGLEENVNAATLAKHYIAGNAVVLTGPEVQKVLM
jgi:hypothetical protein